MRRSPVRPRSAARSRARPRRRASVAGRLSAVVGVARAPRALASPRSAPSACASTPAVGRARSSTSPESACGWPCPRSCQRSPSRASLAAQTDARIRGDRGGNASRHRPVFVYIRGPVKDSDHGARGALPAAGADRHRPVRFGLAREGFWRRRLRAPVRGQALPPRAHRSTTALAQALSAAARVVRQPRASAHRADDASSASRRARRSPRSSSSPASTRRGLIAEVAARRRHDRRRRRARAGLAGGARGRLRAWPRALAPRPRADERDRHRRRRREDHRLRRSSPPALPQRPIDVARLAHRIQYLAPEQLANEATSAATDVFALGVLAYELVTGQRTFARRHPAADRAGDPRPARRPSRRCRGRSCACCSAASRARRSSGSPTRARSPMRSMPRSASRRCPARARTSARRSSRRSSGSRSSTTARCRAWSRSTSAPVRSSGSARPRSRRSGRDRPGRGRDQRVRAARCPGPRTGELVGPATDDVRICRARSAR